MTTQSTTDDTKQAYSRQEYAAAFAIAKDALKYVANFQTPPTPEVYEIWYRFAEGANSELCEQLAYAVNELKLVGRDRIDRLHQQFFAHSGSGDDNADLTDCLAGELGGLESMIHTQITISDDFDAAVGEVGDHLDDDASPDEVRGCVQAVVATSESMRNELQDLKVQLESSLANVESLREDFQESQKILLIDPLTGVGNRRLFDSLMTQSIDASPEEQSSRVLWLVDLDKFKDINDTFGHAAGDEVLRYVASELQRIAPDASITRYGGDEFAVFINCDDPEDIHELPHELRLFFAKHELKMRNTGDTLGNVTLSIGVAILRSHDTIDSWFERADKLLYSAKQSGRNRVLADRKLG